MLKVLPRHIRLPPPVKVLAAVRHGESQACAPLHARRGIAIVVTTVVGLISAAASGVATDARGRNSRSEKDLRRFLAAPFDRGCVAFKLW